MLLVLIFAAAIFFIAIPRTLDNVSWLGLFSVVLITFSGLLAMIGAGINPTPGRSINATIPTTFYGAFLAITNPVRLIRSPVAHIHSSPSTV